LNIETESAIRSHLAPKERLLWNGHPTQGIVFRRADAFMIPFSLFWGGFAFFWEYSVISMDKAPFDERSNGSGTISFGASNFPAWWASGMAWPGMPSQVPTFELSENARSVFETIRNAQGSAT
jgi:hypothetical protein